MKFSIQSSRILKLCTFGIIDNQIILTNESIVISGKKIHFSKFKEFPKFKKLLFTSIVLPTSLKNHRSGFYLEDDIYRLSKRLESAYASFYIKSLDVLVDRLRAANKQASILISSFIRNSVSKSYAANFQKLWDETHNTNYFQKFPPAVMKINTVAKFDKQFKSEKSLFLRNFKDITSKRDELNDLFVQNELYKQQRFFATVEKSPLTYKQRLACVIEEDHQLVLAGAGSGKTSVIIGKVGYLLSNKLATSDEILVLAYGNKASKETDERASERLGDIAQGVTTKTFHALGMDILRTVERIKPMVHELASDQIMLMKRIDEEVVTGFLEKGDNIRLLFKYFILHTAPKKTVNTFDSAKALKEYTEENEMRALKGHLVKSYEELVISNTLFLSGVNYLYECPYQIDTASYEYSQYKPDFYLPDHALYIEHFGISKDGSTASYIDRNKYHEGMEWKRSIHAENDTKLLETYSYENENSKLDEVLIEKLQEFGVSCPFPDKDELISLLNLSEDFSKISQLICDFLSLFKSSQFSDLDELRNSILASKKSKDTLLNKIIALLSKNDELFTERTQVFLDIFEHFWNWYHNILKIENSIDFGDMVNIAVKHIRDGRYKSPFKYILVDEFQDISQKRSLLLKELIRSRKGTSLFAVGDDWQSIYRFTGSAVDITKNFTNEFDYGVITKLDKTFRYNQSIADFSYTFVAKNPSQLDKNIKSYKSSSEKGVTFVVHYNNEDKALEFVMKKLGKTTKSIYVVGRHRFNKPDSLELYKKTHTVSYDTIHGSKGKEGDYVIVSGINGKRRGLPNRMGCDSILELLLPEPEEMIYAEERRLFYVAITRAKEHTYILVDSSNMSSFFQEIHFSNDFDYNIYEIDGESAKALQIHNCSECGDKGHLKYKRLASGNEFYGCSNYPVCTNTADICPSCGKGPLLIISGEHKCSHCSYTEPTCPRCKKGRMKLKNGVYGEFYSCTNYRLTGVDKCSYSANIADLKRNLQSGLDLLEKRAGIRWTEDEEKKLIAEYCRGDDVGAIAESHQRTVGAINARLSKLGLIKP